ncbi:MAG: TolC family protein [Bryobacteraceae bacterium]
MARRNGFTGSPATRKHWRRVAQRLVFSFVSVGISLFAHLNASSQEAETQRASLLIDLKDALARARKYGLQLDPATLAVALAREDRIQAKAATLPSVSAFNQFIYTEGNGTPSGVFIANDGVHVYNEQAQVHEDLLSFVRRGEIRRTQAAEAAARAKLDVAARGLNATVIQDYYSIVASQRKYANAQTSLQEAGRFLDITQKQERGGEAAHSDVIKAQLQLQQRQRDLQDAELVLDKAKIFLGVLIFPDFRQDFSVVDDLQDALVLPPYPELQSQAKGSSPDIRAGQAGLLEARYASSVARYAYLPTFGLDFFYGINANQFAAQTSYPTQATGRSTLPNYLVPYRQNLGYSAEATLTIPVWDWGGIRSKVKQADLRRRQAETDLTLAQRQLQANLESFYREAQTAQSQAESLRSSADLAAESLQLTVLRYQAGEATVLEVVDAQTTVTQARNALDDGLVRNRVARAQLETLTGSF